MALNMVKMVSELTFDNANRRAVMNTFVKSRGQNVKLAL